jgi:hypothetical protein
MGCGQADKNLVVNNVANRDPGKKEVGSRKVLEGGVRGMGPRLELSYLLYLHHSEDHEESYYAEYQANLTVEYKERN